jgi:hypothetical protein
MDERRVDGRGGDVGDRIGRTCRLREWRPDAHASHDDDHNSRYNNYIDVNDHHHDYDAGAHP